MRDPGRLDDFYDKLKELHRIYVPDWRFGQLMYNFICWNGDPFFLEEDAFLERMEKYLIKERGDVKRYIEEGLID